LYIAKYATSQCTSLIADVLRLINNNNLALEIPHVSCCYEPLGWKAIYKSSHLKFLVIHEKADLENIMGENISLYEQIIRFLDRILILLRVAV